MSIPGQPIDDTSTIRNAIGGDPISLSSDEIKSGLGARLDNADSLLLTDIYGTVPERSVCQGGVCNVAGSNVYLSDVDVSATYEAVMSRYGVDVAQGRSISTEGDVTTDSQAYGAWADHNFFFIELDTYSTDAGVYATSMYGASIGDATGSVPASGSATWKGVVVAIEMVREEGYQGDAILTANFAAFDLDVMFTNMHDVETGQARASISFDDVPLTTDGFASRADGRIEGKFYGPDHAEAGGIFERGNTIGAFGAKRQ